MTHRVTQGDSDDFALKRSQATLIGLHNELFITAASVTLTVDHLELSDCRIILKHIQDVTCHSFSLNEKVFIL